MIKSGCRGLRESKNALQPQYIKTIVHDKSKIKIIKMTENIKHNRNTTAVLFKMLTVQTHYNF